MPSQTPAAKQVGLTERRPYSFDSDRFIGIEKRHLPDLECLFFNLRIADSASPATVRLVRNLFRSHVGNILYYERKARNGRIGYISLLITSVAFAVIIPIVTTLFTLRAMNGSSIETHIIILSTALTSALAGWQVLQSSITSRIQVNERHLASAALRKNLYEFEAERRGDVDERMRDAGLELNVGSRSNSPSPWLMSPEEEREFRKRLQIRIDAAERIVEQETARYFAAVYKPNLSIPNPLQAIQESRAAVNQLLVDATTAEQARKARAEAKRKAAANSEFAAMAAEELTRLKERANTLYDGERVLVGASDLSIDRSALVLDAKSVSKLDALRKEQALVADLIKEREEILKEHDEAKRLGVTDSPSTTDGT